MDSYEQTSPRITPEQPSSFSDQRQQRRKILLISSVIGFAVFVGISSIIGFFLVRRNTENRSQAALETTAPVVTTGKDGCFSTVLEQGSAYLWQDTCQGRASTDNLTVAPLTSATTLSLVPITTGAISSTQLPGGGSLSPTGVEQYSLIANAAQNVQSMSYELNGKLYRIDSERPFSVTRNEGVGYLPLTSIGGLRAGLNFLQITSYDQKEATGSAIKKETAVLSVQSRGTDRACEKTPVPLFSSEITKYKQWVSSGKPLQAGCPAPAPSTVSTTTLPLLGCSSSCTTDIDCNGSLVTLVLKKPAGVATAGVIESVIVNGVNIEEDGKELTYRGAWVPYVSPTLYSGKGIIYSVAPDASVSFYATGPYALVTTDTGTNRLGFDVYIDGIKQANTGLENLTVAGNGVIADLSNYKLKTVAIGIPTKPSVFSCSDISGKKMCRIKTNTADSTCLIPNGTNTTITAQPSPVTVPALCNTTCSSEATCDEVTVKLVPKYASATVKYAVIDKITVGDTVRQETDASLTYTGAWLSYGPVAGYMDGASVIRYVASTNAAGTPTVSFKVNASSFTIRTDKGANRSGFDVYINDVKIPSTALDNLNQAGTTYSAFETTITIPGYDANTYTCATAGTGKACRLTSKPTSVTCTP